ncbi:uncharacterized protein LOC133795732 [Humulus lupulus]|uniref:uncharacterized protein LOC133795732 n=1 Tax=Humulus lupulus TaxID=3486 RepID=UPI002B40E114|nr:uncharacterized protein LOC133795732 [Humulus lupulus]
MNGDENTAIFHASLKARRIQNRIYSIHTEQGTWVDTVDGVQRAFLDYYQNLLGTQLQSRRKVSPAIVDLGPGISEAHSRLLVESFTAQEVKEALFSIPGKLLKEINATTITLIPKIKCPGKVSDFRPISCCNVLYKIASKMICARLRRVLPDLIAENQGGFVHGRYIAHNIMICQDLVQHYGRKNCKPSCLIKVDLQKAYDTIEWDFIEEMLAAFKFPKKLIQLIMICVRTPKFSLMLNGSLCGFFVAKRGLRQGDPNVSIIVCVRGLKLFSGTFGLVPNQNKSAIYCSGMIEAEVNRILEASGFARSQLPFRYLGIPICSKRISSVECGLILEKMMH